jgi:hypothetical protein
MSEQTERAPVMGYLTGATLLILNDSLLRDSDGELLEPEELYEVSMDGIHRVPDDPL